MRLPSAADFPAPLAGGFQRGFDLTLGLDIAYDVGNSFIAHLENMRYDRLDAKHRQLRLRSYLYFPAHGSGTYPNSLRRHETYCRCCRYENQQPDSGYHYHVFPGIMHRSGGLRSLCQSRWYPPLYAAGLYH